MRRLLARLCSLVLLIPYALGWAAGLLVLACVLCWLALRDGYAAGRRKEREP